MFSPLSLIVVVCFLLGTAIVIALAARAGSGWRSDGSIAQVLYDAEHPEKRR